MTEAEEKDWHARKRALAHLLRSIADRLENIVHERPAWMAKLNHELEGAVVQSEELERDA